MTACLHVVSCMCMLFILPVIYNDAKNSNSLYLKSHTLFLHLHCSILLPTYCGRYLQFFSMLWHHLSDDECIFITLCLPYLLLSSSFFTLFGVTAGQEGKYLHSFSHASSLQIHSHSATLIHHLISVQCFMCLCTRMHMGGGGGGDDHPLVKCLRIHLCISQHK